MWVTGGKGGLHQWTFGVWTCWPVLLRCWLQRTPRGLPESILSLRSHYNGFGGTNLILSANPGYQASHRSFRSNTVWVWLQYLSLLQKNLQPFFSVKYWKQPLKLSLFLPREAETLICQWCLNVSPVQWVLHFFWQIEEMFAEHTFTQIDPDIVNT